jgi:hypothetical protein
MSTQKPTGFFQFRARLKYFLIRLIAPYSDNNLVIFLILIFYTLYAIIKYFFLAFAAFVLIIFTIMYWYDFEAYMGWNINLPLIIFLIAAGIYILKPFSS